MFHYVRRKRFGNLFEREKEKGEGEKKGENLSANVIREIARVFEYRSLKTSFETMGGWAGGEEGG